MAKLNVMLYSGRDCKKPNYKRTETAKAPGAFVQGLARGNERPFGASLRMYQLLVLGVLKWGTSLFSVEKEANRKPTVFGGPPV